MATAIEVQNRALLKLGAERIASIEDESKEAIAMRLAWEHVRDRVMAAYPWTFALKRASLASLVEVPVWGFDRLFQLPDDYLALDWIDGAGGDAQAASLMDGTEDAWRIEGGRIATNLSAPLKIVYRARVEDPQQWGPMFCEALAVELAYELCDHLTGNLQRKGIIERERVQAVAAARRQNAIQQAPRYLPDSAWLQSRV